MTANTKRVVFTMGGKGGVGKTGVMVALAEWFEANQIPVTLLDLDTENKARGSCNIFSMAGHQSQHSHAAGLDAFVDHLDAALPSFLPIWEPVLDRWRPTGLSRCTTMSLQPVSASQRWRGHS